MESGPLGAAGLALSVVLIIKKYVHELAPIRNLLVAGNNVSAMLKKLATLPASHVQVGILIITHITRYHIIIYYSIKITHFPWQR